MKPEHEQKTYDERGAREIGEVKDLNSVLLDQRVYLRVYCVFVRYGSSPCRKRVEDDAAQSSMV
jgi:hypothetical protein